MSTTRGASCIVVGGGLVGLATAAAVLAARPNTDVTLIEKEATLATHQSGRNSGVVHSGIYYPPGSAKALNCRRGRGLLLDFAAAHDIAIDMCGKVIVATEQSELPALHQIAERGAANGVEATLIGPARLAEIEPHVRGVAALHVPDAGIIDYPGVAAALADEIRTAGGTILTSTQVMSGAEDDRGVRVTTSAEVHRADVLVACAGLQSDLVAGAFGAMDRGLAIVPFRGEYFQLSRAAEQLCRSLIYPVPDPRFPFLGVHLTRHISGRVLAGPNAVLALAREGYGWGEVSPRDLQRMASDAGLRHLAREHWKTGLGEMWRSMNRRAFVTALQKMTPDITTADLEPHPAGVRAQALWSDGRLADDFVFHETQRTVHVLNAPSPAATASLAIGETLSEKALSRLPS